MYDDAGKSQGTVFLEVKTLYGTGPAGRSILCDYITALDEYYRYWVTTADGVATTVDGNYHLCRGDPTTCQGRPGGSQIVHVGKWRIWKILKELVGEQATHLEGAAIDEMLKYFIGRGGGPRGSKAGELPWEDKPLHVEKGGT